MNIGPPRVNNSDDIKIGMPEQYIFNEMKIIKTKSYSFYINYVVIDNTCQQNFRKTQTQKLDPLFLMKCLALNPNPVAKLFFFKSETLKELKFYLTL